MNKILLTITAGFISLFSFSQQIDKTINVAEVERIEKILSADDMQGRRTFTPGIDKAADFIETEFAKNKLKYFGKAKSYTQDFVVTKVKPLEISGMLDNDSLNSGNVLANTTAAEIIINSFADFEIVKLKKEDNFVNTVFPLLEQEKNVLILLDTAHAKLFKRMQQFVGAAHFQSAFSKLMILTPLQFNCTSVTRFRSKS